MIPNGITTIADSAFSGCNLTGVILPESLTRIGNNAFEGPLASVIIPSSVTSIGFMAFNNYDLRSAIFMGNAPSMDGIAFNAGSTFTVYYFDGAAGFTSPTWTPDYSNYRALNLGANGAVSVRALSSLATPVDGAQWQVDGGEWHYAGPVWKWVSQLYGILTFKDDWHNRGTVLGGLSAGRHTIAFKAVRGYVTPPTQFFTVNSHQVATVTGTYVSFSSKVGAFAGTLEGGGGLVTLSLTSSGDFTGKLILRGKSYSLKGAFDANGNYSQTVGSPPVAIALHIDPSQADDSLGGFLVTGSVGGVAFSAYHAVSDGKHPANEAGKYTILLRPTTPDAPQGTGYAKITVTTAGTVKMSGKLADNTSFSASGPIVRGTNGNQFFLYKPSIYGGKGLLAGTLAFETLASSDCKGTLQWFKPWHKNGGYFKTGFDTDLELAGARYVRPGAHQAALPISTGTLALNGGSLSQPITENLTLFTTNALTVDGANPEKLNMVLNARTGLFSGSFIHPATKKALRFGGVLYQNQSAPQACGFFLGPILSGTGWSGNVSLTR